MDGRCQPARVETEHSDEDHRELVGRAFSDSRVFAQQRAKEKPYQRPPPHPPLFPLI